MANVLCASLTGMALSGGLYILDKSFQAKGNVLHVGRKWVKAGLSTLILYILLFVNLSAETVTD